MHYVCHDLDVYVYAYMYVHDYINSSLSDYFQQHKEKHHSITQIYCKKIYNSQDKLLFFEVLFSERLQIVTKGTHFKCSWKRMPILKICAGRSIIKLHTSILKLTGNIISS